MTSPDGKVAVDILDGGEFRMGGPLICTIALSTGHRFDDCGGAMTFSDDSRHLAVAVWDQRANVEGVRLVQRILIVAAHSGASVRWPGEFEELEFRAFRGGILHAVSSPKGNAQEFCIGSRMP